MKPYQKNIRSRKIFCQWKLNVNSVFITLWNEINFNKNLKLWFRKFGFFRHWTRYKTRIIYTKVIKLLFIMKQIHWKKLFNFMSNAKDVFIQCLFLLSKSIWKLVKRKQMVLPNFYIITKVFWIFLLSR